MQRSKSCEPVGVGVAAALCWEKEKIKGTGDGESVYAEGDAGSGVVLVRE